MSNKPVAEKFTLPEKVGDDKWKLFSLRFEAGVASSGVVANLRRAFGDSLTIKKGQTDDPEIVSNIDEFNPDFIVVENGKVIDIIEFIKKLRTEIDNGLFVQTFVPIRQSNDIGYREGINYAWDPDDIYNRDLMDSIVRAAETCNFLSTDFEKLIYKQFLSKITEIT